MRSEFATGSACVSLNLGFQVRQALRLLLDAADYADDLGRDFWDFALVIRELRAAGLSDNDLRWLARIPTERTGTNRSGDSCWFSPGFSFSGAFLLVH